MDMVGLGQALGLYAADHELAANGAASVEFDPHRLRHSSRANLTHSCDPAGAARCQRSIPTTGERAGSVERHLGLPIMPDGKSNSAAAGKAGCTTPGDIPPGHLSKFFAAMLSTGGWINLSPNINVQAEHCRELDLAPSCWRPTAGSSARPRRSDAGDRQALLI